MPAKANTIFKCGRDGQRGAVLMIMLVLLVVGVAVVLINSLTTVAAKNARQEKTALALAQAKEALIGYAVTYGDTHTEVPGYLPCPDTDGNLGLQPEGSAEYGTSPCANNNANMNISVMGRLPWKTLDLSVLRDGDGECLWYAVSGTYKNLPKTGLMNWDTSGQFQTYGSDGTQLTNPNQVVAVVFAPGAPLMGQDRSGTTAPICGGNYTASNYLDSGTVNSISFDNTAIATGQFIQGTSSGSINDRMVFITLQDIWNAIQKRTDFQPALKLLTRRVAECLANYGQYNTAGGGGWGGGGWGGGGGGWGGGGGSNNSLPWPAPLVFPAGGDYSVNANYHDLANLYAGRVPYNVSTSSSTTGNSFSNIMTTTNCPAGWASVDPWWNNWKDHLFYAIGQTFKPSSNTNQSCGTCLSINGSGHYAAVVMFANSRLAGTTPAQVRASDTTSSNRSNIDNYLEGNNAANYKLISPPADGNENYITVPASSTFNDVLCTIDGNLNVSCP